MNKEEVLKHSKLSRIHLENEEAESLSQEIEAILGYVGEIKKAHDNTSSTERVMPAIKNVLRQDNNPHETGVYTEVILEGAPAREGDYIKVKKILS
jgi:aspartyl/glutamyl-tRNA(Asn/Gln) amidotransferase C subunit